MAAPEWAASREKPRFLGPAKSQSTVVTLPKQKRHFPFLVLMRELRDMTYRSPFNRDRPVRIFRGRTTVYRHQNPNQLHESVALLQMCRQVHAEASCLLYGTDVLAIFGMVSGSAVRSGLGKGSVSCLRERFYWSASTKG